MAGAVAGGHDHQRGRDPVLRRSMTGMRSRLRVSVILAVLLLLASVARAEEPATLVGAQACAGCHAAQAAAWQPSPHASAIQPATAATALDACSGAKPEHFGVTPTLFRDGGCYMARTDG